MKRLQIVKVGGSLFQLPDLGERIKKWLLKQHDFFSVLIPGCGKLGNSIREYDARFQLGDTICHNICAELLELQSQVLHKILSETITLDKVLDIYEQQINSRNISYVIFNAKNFLTDDEPNYPGEKLPIGWDVSTDSIAARLAEIADAHELVLLKAIAPPTFIEIAELADANYVDSYFPWAIKPVKEVRFVNLSDKHFPEWYGFEG
jgi:5-(aminomethyl)-3-furanmethanol phosphate kinase